MNKYFAELVGTFVLVFGGVGSAVLAGSHIGFAGISAAFGLSLLAMVYTIGPISGCHVNPAVTLGVFLARKINARDAAAYMVAQVIGAIISWGFPSPTHPSTRHGASVRPSLSAAGPCNSYGCLSSRRSWVQCWPQS